MNPPPSTPLPDPKGQDVATAVTVPEPDAASAPGRHRRHRFPARAHALKVLYGDDEHAMIRHAAETAGLRPSSYVATAALAMAEQVHTERHADQAGDPRGKIERPRHAQLSPHQNHELLAELIQARLALRRYAVNVNQIAAVLNSGGLAPVWLPKAVAGADRAVASIDAGTEARPTPHLRHPQIRSAESKGGVQLGPPSEHGAACSGCKGGCNQGAFTAVRCHPLPAALVP